MRRGRWTVVGAVALGACFGAPDNVGEGMSTGVPQTSSSTETATDSSVTTGGTTTTTTGPGSTTAVSTGTGDPPATSTGVETTGGLPIDWDFEDDFERRDGLELGNDWNEETPDVFSLESGRVVGAPTSNDALNFHDWFVYRDDEHRDLEIRIEFAVTEENVQNEPFIVVRVPSASIGDPATEYRGYMAVAGSELTPGTGDPGGYLCLMRYDGVDYGPVEVWCDPQTPETLQTGYVYRLSLAAVGIGPVELETRLERRDPQIPDGWEPVAYRTASDDDGERISESGHWGFGAGGSQGELDNYTYDNFAMRAL